MRYASTYLGLGAALTAATVGAFWLLASAGVVGRDWWVALAMIALALEATVLLFLARRGAGADGPSGFSDPYEVYAATTAREVSPSSSTAHEARQRSGYQIRFLWAAIPPGLTALVLIFVV